jgi:hypothetical protein
MITAAAGSILYSAGLTKEVKAYSGALRLMSEGRDFLGRFEAAHLAALSFTCFAKQTVLLCGSRKTGD